jgi:hypothetical protein
MAVPVSSHDAEPDDAGDGQGVDDGIDPSDVVRRDHRREQPGRADRHQDRARPMGAACPPRAHDRCATASAAGAGRRSCRRSCRRRPRRSPSASCASGRAPSRSASRGTLALCASQPTTSGAANAPRLMPM